MSPKGPPQKCPYCFNMMRMESIKRHKEICIVLQPYVINKTQCGKCLKTFQNQGALYGHFRKKHPEVGENAGMEQCSVCLHYVSVYTCNTEHLRVCKKVIEFANLQDYSCKICQQSLIDQKNLYLHIENHLTKIELPSKRHKKFVQNYTQVGESFQCSKCSVTCDSQDVMIDHLKLQKEVLRKTNQSNIEDNFVINAANSGLSTEAVNALKESVSQSENFESEPHWEATAVNCPTDWKKIKTPKTLHFCPYCSKKFPSWSIKKHKQICQIVQPLIVNENQCRLCWKKCKNGLHTHFNLFHPELIKNADKEQCPICSNYFPLEIFKNNRQTDHLSSCRRVINFADLENFSCKICHSKYDQQGKLYTHIQRKHSEVVEKYALSQENSVKGNFKDKNLGIELFYKRLSDRYHCFKCNISCKCKGTFIDHLKIDHNTKLREDLTIEQEDLLNEDENLVLFYTKDHKNNELPSEIITVNNLQVETEENIEPSEKINEKSDFSLEKSKKLKDLDKFAKNDNDKTNAEMRLSNVAKIKIKLSKEESFYAIRKPKKKYFTQGKVARGKKCMSVCVHCLEPHSNLNIEKHEEVCKAIKPYIINKNQCRLCLKTLKKKGLLFNRVNHFRMAHPDVAQNLGKAQCQICFHYISIYRQDTHERSCKKYYNFANLENFSCKLCGSPCKSQGQVYCHIEQNHFKEVENNISYQECSKKGHEKDFIQIRKEKVTPFNEIFVECPEVENIESFPVEKEMNQEPEVENQMEITYKPKTKSNVMIIGEKNHQAEVENQMKTITETKTKSNKMITGEKNHGPVVENQMEMIEETKIKSNGIVLGSFKCQLCSEVFVSMQDVEKHIQVFHKISDAHFMPKQSFYSLIK